MFCKYCGSQIPDNSRMCPACGNALNPGGQGYAGNYQGQQMQYGGVPRKRIDNIFSALVHEKTPGAILEFSLWCTVCLVSFLSIIATAVSGGNAAWILMLIFSIGMAVIMAFRLKPIAMLYSVVAFPLIIGIVHFVVFGYASYSAINITFFIIILLATIALVVFCILQFFTRFRFGTVCSILSISISGVSMIMHICIYVAPKWGIFSRYDMNDDCYWLGTISLWLLYIVSSMLFAFFFWGCIDSRKDKIMQSAGALYTVGSIRCLTGMYQGRVFSLNGGVLSIGSQAGVNIAVQDPMVSPRHCMIRFNSASGLYEVYDDSNTGIFLNDGTRLQRGVYNAVPRGKVICLGSAAQQFQLL